MQTMQTEKTTAEDPLCKAKHGTVAVYGAGGADSAGDGRLEGKLLVILVVILATLAAV